jgi:hypothetical protein
MLVFEAIIDDERRGNGFAYTRADCAAWSARRAKALSIWRQFKPKGPSITRPA